MIVLGLDSHGVLRIRDSLRSSPRWCVGTVSQKRAAVLCRASPRVLRWRGVGCCRAATARVRCWRRWACLHTRTSAQEQQQQEQQQQEQQQQEQQWAGRGVGVGAAWAAG